MLFFMNYASCFISGVLMWEVFSEGKTPYENRTNAEVVEEVSAGLRLYKPRHASNTIYNLMQHCWNEVSTPYFMKERCKNEVIYSPLSHPTLGDFMDLTVKSVEKRFLTKWHFLTFYYLSIKDITKLLSGSFIIEKNVIIQLHVL